MKKTPYQIEYENSVSCFWETSPGKYVRLLVEKYGFNPQGKKILDIGAGEGKNAVYLASLGAIVTAIDVSSIALSRFNLQPKYECCKNNIVSICADVRECYFGRNEFDVIISYGLFHSFNDKNEIYCFLDKIKNSLKSNGYFVIVTFTDELPPPENQKYLEYDAFIDKISFLSFMSDYEVIVCEDEVIKESHPTNDIEHFHSLIRVIYKK